MNATLNAPVDAAEVEPPVLAAAAAVDDAADDDEPLSVEPQAAASAATARPRASGPSLLLTISLLLSPRGPHGRGPPCASLAVTRARSVRPAPPARERARQV